MPEQEVIRWEAHEHEHTHQERDWYWALGIVAASAAATSILFHDTLFALVIIMAATTIGLIAQRQPHLMRFEASDKGLRTGDTLHRWSEIIGFWVEDEHDAEPLLLVDTVKFLSPNLIIPLADADPAAVRALLRKHAEEVPMREPIGYKILRFFGF